MKILLLLTALSLYSCTKPNEPPPPKPPNPLPERQVFTITVEDYTCIETWLKITNDSLPLPANISIRKNDKEIKQLTLTTRDTIVYIDSLLPKQACTFKAISRSDTLLVSNAVTTTTMDTTSHNFTWQSWTFGQHSNSVLYDVAIIDENNIWAVGKIYMNDSLGNPDPIAYNAVHWDGQRWNLKKIYYKGGIWTIRCVFALNENDVWFSGYMRYDGTKFIELPIPSILMGWQINKMWGSSSNDLYVVGNGGNIAHYDGTNWTKINSGTTVDLRDVWGSKDGKIIWACEYNSNYALTILVKISNSTVTKIFEGSPNEQSNNIYIGPLSGGWTDTKKRTVLLNWGLLCLQENKDEIDLSALQEEMFYDIGLTISANGINDIMVAGQSGMVGHYNGYRFYDIPDLRIRQQQYLGSDLKSNLFVTVGYNYSTIFSKAIIAIGKRN